MNFIPINMKAAFIIYQILMAVLLRLLVGLIATPIVLPNIDHYQTV